MGFPSYLLRKTIVLLKRSKAYLLKEENGSFGTDVYGCYLIGITNGKHVGYSDISDTYTV